MHAAGAELETGFRAKTCVAEALIYVRRTWTCGEVGLPKSKASKAPVPLHPLLAEFILRWQRQTPYAQANDWVFPSFKLKGRQPRVPLRWRAA
jgi:hypothetical protein